MIHKIQIAVLFLLIPIGGLYLYSKDQGIPIREIFTPGVAVMDIGEIPLRVEIADTEEERTKGLSGRKDFKTANGILFVFDKPDYHGVWMKDMNFPIDIIWIDENLTVIGVDKGVAPNTYPKTFRPSRPALYVVETNDWYTQTFGISAGEKVRLPLEVQKK